MELPVLRDHQIMRPYFPREVEVVSKELHGFCDASEDAFSGVIYLRAIDTKGDVHVLYMYCTCISSNGQDKSRTLKAALDSTIGLM